MVFYQVLNINLKIQTSAVKLTRRAMNDVDCRERDRDDFKIKIQTSSMKLTRRAVMLTPGSGTGMTVN